MSILDYAVESCRNVNCGTKIYLIFFDYEGKYCVRCTRCQTIGPVAATQQLAVERWNKLQKPDNQP